MLDALDTMNINRATLFPVWTVLPNTSAPESAWTADPTPPFSASSDFSNPFEHQGAKGLASCPSGRTSEFLFLSTTRSLAAEEPIVHVMGP